MAEGIIDRLIVHELDRWGREEMDSASGVWGVGWRVVGGEWRVYSLGWRV